MITSYHHDNDNVILYVCVSKNCPTPPAGRRRDAAAAVCTEFAGKLQAGCCPLSARRLVANISAAAGAALVCGSCANTAAAGAGAELTTSSQTQPATADDSGTSAAVETLEIKNTTGVTEPERC